LFFFAVDGVVDGDDEDLGIVVYEGGKEEVVMKRREGGKGVASDLEGSAADDDAKDDDYADADCNDGDCCWGGIVVAAGCDGHVGGTCHSNEDVDGGEVGRNT